jgi:hypothetical protein
MSEDSMNKNTKPNNLRTGLLLGALALFFFCLLFVKKLWLG